MFINQVKYSSKVVAQSVHSMWMFFIALEEGFAIIIWIYVLVKITKPYTDFYDDLNLQNVGEIRPKSFEVRLIHDQQNFCNILV